MDVVHLCGFKVYNPNHYPISIKDIDVEAHLNGKKIGMCQR